MPVPERYWRFPTGAAIDSLSARFGFRNKPDMQDWEYQVADASRLGEFMAALNGELTDDERFTLTATVMQCFEDRAQDGVHVTLDEQWQRFVALLRARPSLHAFTLCYWSSLEPAYGVFAITPIVRPLWAELEPAVGRAG